MQIKSQVEHSVTCQCPTKEQTVVRESRYLQKQVWTLLSKTTNMCYQNQKEFWLTHSFLARLKCVFGKYVIWNHTKREMKMKKK